MIKYIKKIWSNFITQYNHSKCYSFMEDIGIACMGNCSGNGCLCEDCPFYCDLEG